jgi:hypothetical protein
MNSTSLFSCPRIEQGTPFLLEGQLQPERTISARCNKVTEKNYMFHRSSITQRKQQRASVPLGIIAAAVVTASVAGCVDGA